MIVSHTIPLRLNPATKLLLAYLVLAYVIPSALISIYGVPEYYIEAIPRSAPTLVLILSLLAFLAIGNLRRNNQTAHFERYTFRSPSSHLQTLALLALTIAAIYGYANGFSGFRYSDQGLAERGSPMAFAYAAVPTLLQCFLLVYAFYDRNATRLTVGATFRRCLLAVGLLLSANGIVTMLVAMAGTTYLFFPQTMQRVLINRGAAGDGKLGARMLRRASVITLLVILAVLAASGWVLGEATKRGELGSVVDLITGEGVAEWFLLWAAERSSPSYISLMVALDRYALATDWSVVREHFLAPLQSLAFRADYLFLHVFDVPRPDDGSIMRINYNLIETNPSNFRAGTSPGLIASFLYCFPFPLNFTVLIAYMLLLQRFLSRLVSALPGRLTLIGLVVFLHFMLPLFASPIDLLLIIDDGTIGVVALIALRSVLIRKNNSPLETARDATTGPQAAPPKTAAAQTMA